MLSTVSQDFLDAVTATRRRVVPRMIVDIIDPDMTDLSASANDAFYYSRLDQVTDQETVSQDKYITLEKNRWILNGEFAEFPIAPRFIVNQVGYISDEICDANGDFATPPTLTITFANVDSLSSCGVDFSNNPYDGYATDFDVTIVGDTTATVNVTGNTALQVPVEGFTVTNPTSITIQINSWSLPLRRARVIELYPGVLETWDESQITDLDIVHEMDLSNLSLPNGSCNMTFYNAGNRFNPYNKDGLFNSLESRQRVQAFMGLDVGGGVIEYAPVGMFYMTDDCWRLNSDGMTMTFSMADLIGLVKDRLFTCPSPTPTTLAGWLQAVLSTLGTNFRNLYEIDNDVPNTSMTVTDVTYVNDQPCGDVLCWLAQASLGYMRCDQSTGKIRVSAWPSATGDTLTLGNMSHYPEAKNRGDVANFIFQYYDNTTYTIPGTQEAADQDVTVHNPFIEKNTIAGTIIANIKKCYGTPEITVRGRGNPASEIGDIDTIDTWLAQSPSAYRVSQQLRLQDGIMADVQSVFLEVKV